MQQKIINRRCDIVIPIYNAYECLCECIESVIKNTNLEDNNLIIIDDKSTDKRIVELLEKYKEKYPKFVILKNEENLGFVGTVNKGMKLSRNDILLLNSDTVVTSGWLEKIKECAYSGNLVATVIPLSNNATLASVPKIFEKNELPNEISLEKMSEIVEKCSYKDYPELPTGHGFCLYIKRSVLKEVGYFDEKSFGKGYGEENDFCYRCFEHGYRHLLCDNAYVYHKESQSFSNTKFKLMRNGEKILEERYPRYQIRLREWCTSRPIQYIGHNISFELGKIKKKQNILILIHDWKDVEENLGGTTLHVYDLIKGLRDKYNFHVLTPEDNVYKLYSYWTETESQIKFPKSVNFKDFGYYNKEYEKMLERIVLDFDIEVVHIHHMIGHYFDITNVISKHKLYSLISLHDLYSVCPVINKIYKGKMYCGNPSMEKCGNCLKTYLGKEHNMIEIWHREWKSLFNTVDVTITPSESAKEEIQITHKNLNISVIEHGIDLRKSASDLSIEDKEFFDIAFVGVIVKHKGNEVLEYLVKRAKMKKIKIHLFGQTDVLLKNSKYFKNHGRYKRKELSQLLRENNIHLVCLFSMCPETYSYTLTESIACGVPVIGVDIGAIGERVRRENLGWLIDIDSNSKEYATKIRKVLSDPKEYKEIIKNINKYKIRTTKQMVDDYKSLYAKLGQKVKKNNYGEKDIKDLFKISDTYFLNTNGVTYPDYSWVFNTFKWKIISKLKIPQSIKKIYFKVRNRQ